MLLGCGPRSPAAPEEPAPAPAPAPAVASDAPPTPGDWPAAAAPEPPAVPSATDEIAGLDPDGQWAWAVARFPALAEHAALDRTELVAQLSEWFPDGRVWVRTASEACFPVKGTWTEDAFVGSARETVKVSGRTKTRTAYTVEIAPSGVVEMGPGGETFTRNKKGEWALTGGFGTGCFDVLVRASVSEVTPDAVYFAAYDYTLTIECAGTSTTTDVCEGGGTRTCESCSSFWAQPHASGRGFGRGTIGIRASKSTPIDCSVPCPADTVTPLLEPLNAIVKGRRFTGTTTLEGAVYKSRRTCERDPRWNVVAGG